MSVQSKYSRGLTALRGMESKAPEAEPMTSITTMTERIGPDVARAYLALNLPNNRTYRSNYATELALEMKQGRWRESGDPIRFDTNGHLIDGQHRLNAVILANVALPFVVMRGIAADAVHVIDTGKSRRPADALKVAGFLSTALLASTARILLRVKEGPITIRHYRQPSHAELIDVVRRHPALYESTLVIRPVRGIRPSLTVAMHYIGKQLLELPSAAEAFVKVVNSGIPNYAGDPVHMLREKMLHERGSGKRSMDAASLLAMAHVWNHFSKGSPLKFLRFPVAVSIDGLDTDKI